MRREIWDTNRETLRKKLKDVRLKAELSQEQVAELLGTTQVFVSKYERGERNLDFVEVLLVCKACRYPPVKLIESLKLAL